MNKLFSPFNLGKSGIQVNPYQIGSNILSGFRDSTNYNQNTTLDTINRVGGSMAGNFLSTAGDVAISTGNPYAMAGGAVAKAWGGVADTIAFLKRDIPQIETQASGMNDMYDLGDEAAAVSNMRSSGQVFKDTLKQNMFTGLAALPLAFFARKKAERNQQRAQDALATAQQNYNKVNVAEDARKQQLLQGLLRKQDRY